MQLNLKKNAIWFSGLVALSTLPGCGFNGLQNSAKIAEQLEEKVQCRDIEPLFWHTLHDASLNSSNPDSWEGLKSALMARKTLQNQKLIQIVATLEKYLGEEFWEKPQSEQLEIWAQLELKMEEKAGWVELQQQLSQLFQEQVSDKTTVCNPPDMNDQNVKGPSELGGRFVMATAYQSCEASRIPAMTAETKLAEGIKITGTHPGGGKVRVIGDLKALQATHPYLRIQNKESGCFDVEAKPLIYDFGGKPGYATSGGREMDLFKNGGSGSKELGIDCSAVVFSSFGVQGLRLIPNQDMVAGTASGFGSSSLLNPPSSWKCVERLQVGLNQTIKPGDVVSIKGHTILIDEVGADPWGLRFVADKSQCAKITEDQFDFTILQSSPSKGGVGINRYVARDYLKESSGMRAGLLKYAKAHCQAVFASQNTKPVWSDVSIIRHKGTSECMGRVLTLKNESCVSRCAGVTRP